MKNLLNSLVERVVNECKNDLRNGDYKILRILVGVWNGYQESERDGVDYMFNINNTDDLKTCVDGGMSAKDIHALWSGVMGDKTPYYFFGCNYPNAVQIVSMQELESHMFVCLEELVTFVITYPYYNDSTKKFYTYYISSEFD